MARSRIVLAGEGGQGVQSVAKILVEAGYEAKKNVLYIPNFGVEQRGGVSIAFCQISDTEIGEPRFSKGDIVVMLSDRAIERCSCYVDENTTVIYDTSVCDKTPEVNAKEIIGLPANQIANDELHTRVFNIIILGVILKATGVVDIEHAKAAMELALGKKFDAKPELRDLNYKAMERGIELLDTASVS